MKLCFSYLALTSEFCMSRVCLNIFDIKNVRGLLTIAIHKAGSSVLAEINVHYFFEQV